MGFEYGPSKSGESKRKHGIDFEESQALWLDASRVEIPARVVDEPRWVVIGQIAVDFPEWVVRSIDREARRLGVTRQSLIKMWLADRLQQAG
jgi:hypothetical protein